ncbi:MAG: DUF2911 domain-containing protein [Chitinophagaceae bacterium]|nr:DUF2911 domain-containing protein [Chitinophagaceae bacterium]
MPAPSPTQTIKQDFGIGFIEITYSRPAARERIVFGDLVPFGKIWRTGANEATKIVFSEPVEMGGKKIDSGTYVLYSIPDAGSWEIILNKGLNNWGTNGYKRSEDVVRFTVTPEKIKPALESFTMDFSHIKPASCLLNIKWEKTVVSILIVAEFKTKLKAEIDEAMKTEKKPYWEAAQYYNEYELNLPMALDNVTKAIDEYKEAFWMWIYKAKIQKDMGDKAGAMTSSKKSMELAAAAKNDDYVKMNKELQKSLK